MQADLIENFRMLHIIGIKKRNVGCPKLAPAELDFGVLIIF